MVNKGIAKTISLMVKMRLITDLFFVNINKVIFTFLSVGTRPYSVEIWSMLLSTEIRSIFLRVRRNNSNFSGEHLPYMKSIFIN